MPCRVGITTEPQTRKARWKDKHPKLRNWQQKKIGKRDEAQAAEDRLAKKHGCQAHHGGSKPDNRKPWYVYYFEY